MSLEQLNQKQRKANWVLFVLVIIGFGGLLFSVRTELLNYLNYITPEKQPTKMEIKAVATQAQQATEIQLSYNTESSSWLMHSPYQTKASETVIKALLGRLKTTCHGEFAVDSINSERFASITTDHWQYQVGELNPVTNEVFILLTNRQTQQSTWQLCDKTIAAIALAPAVNFVDRQLYSGNAKKVTGSFGEVTIDDPLSPLLDVIEIAKANPEKLTAIVDTIEIQGDIGKKRYQVLLNSDGKHLLLTPVTQIQNTTAKSVTLVYVIKATPALLKIIGL